MAENTEGKTSPLTSSYVDETENKTGSWRSGRKPSIDYSKCIGELKYINGKEVETCLLCVEYCPDDLIGLKQIEGKTKPVIDSDYCKGCGICIEVCPDKISAINWDNDVEKISLPDMSNLTFELFDKAGLKEIIWVGRGGQGAKTSSELIANAAMLEGKYNQSFPEFGPERTGAPVKAYTRIDKNTIDKRYGIYNADVIVFLDPSLIDGASLANLNKNGKIIINTKGLDEENMKIAKSYKNCGIEVYYVDATRISLETLHKETISTSIIGAVAKATNLVERESLMHAIGEKFKGREKENIEAMLRSFDSVEMV